MVDRDRINGARAEYRRALGSRLKSARLSRDLSLRQVADRVGVSAPTVLDWERGSAVPVDALILLRAVLRCGRLQELIRAREFLKEVR